MGLKVIDGTPTGISKFIREEGEGKKVLVKRFNRPADVYTIKEKKLPELQAEEAKCVFCDASNQSVNGGYFRQRFLCESCCRGLIELDYKLGWSK